MSDVSRDGTDRMERIEDHLHGILSELDANHLDSIDRINIETCCQKIHSQFGGEDPEAIYRDLDTDTDRNGDDTDD